MHWINTKDIPLPKDGETYLALWKGQFCLTSWNEDISRFYLQMLPGVYGCDMEVATEREGKFTHWCKLEYPKDY